MPSFLQKRAKAIYFTSTLNPKPETLNQSVGVEGPVICDHGLRMVQAGQQQAGAI